MASIQKKGNAWYGQFVYHGKRRTFTIGRVSEEEARAKSDQVDYLLMRLSQGLLTLPPGADIVTFVRNDGSIPASGGQARRDTPTLAMLRDRCLESHSALRTKREAPRDNWRPSPNF